MSYRNDILEKYDAMPRWKKFFYMFDFKDGQIKGPRHVLAFWITYAWLLVPRAIFNFNMKEVESYIPGWVSKEHGVGHGDQVRSFFGIVMIPDEGIVAVWQWWKLLHRYKGERKKV